MIKDFWKYVIMFFVLVLIQVLVLNNIQISGFINPYIYILFILLLPFNIQGYLLLGLSFLIGITIDIFGNTPGIHAGATVLLGFIRPGLANLISSRELIEKGTTPNMIQLGNTLINSKRHTEKMIRITQSNQKIGFSMWC